MIGFKSLIFAALALLQAVHSAEYTVAVKYNMDDIDANCNKHAATFNRISDIALYKAGVIGQNNLQHWAVYDSLQGELVENENELTKLELELLAFNHATNNNPERRLCGGMCKTLCLATNHNYWCDCCPCCGGHGRRRRNLRTLQVEDTEEVDTLEDLAEDAVLAELNRYHINVPCLAYPYSVTVDIVAEGESVEEHKTKKEARLARRAAKAARIANKDARKADKAAKRETRKQLRRDLKLEVRASRDKLKAVRELLAMAQKAAHAAEKAELDAEKAWKEVEAEEEPTVADAQQGVPQGEAGEETP